MLLGILTWAICVGYVFLTLDRHWVADDEGLLAQTAERVLLGELPHRDFADVYTGGQSYLHAAAFRIWGASLLAPRYMLLAFVAAWVPAVFYAAMRLAAPVAAVPLTILAVAWSVPNYAAA
ncbi:MAG TPA: hypothetical protein VFU46_11550, partial [Gemmatimonadales bacterium]|nr:hypothetical protein [Gemmatimonadales bacterium]